MRRKFKILRKKLNWKQLGIGVSLWMMSTFLNMVPIVYSCLDDWRNAYAEGTFNLSQWLSNNSDVYFLLLSAVFTSFIEYILTVKGTTTGLVSFNILYVVLISSVWAVVKLRTDLVHIFAENVNLSSFLCFLCAVSVVFCLTNLLFMNVTRDSDSRQSYTNKRIV